MTDDPRFGLWLDRVSSYALCESGIAINRNSDYWRESFEHGMTPEQAFIESFAAKGGSQP